jgi:RHS repeat-associated protein
MYRRTAYFEGKATRRMLNMRLHLERAAVYTYDSAGRRSKVIDALGHETSFIYDAAGNQTQVTDANGNATGFVYDSANRRTEVDYPDGSKDLTGYDALGRNVSKTDQAGQLTQFRYDALGRLVKVIDALNQETTYGYDERGNQTSQTDANGHTTSFAYDGMGRRISRTLPGGQIETMEYDIGGNLTAKTDFNGKRTVFEYDNLNRLVKKTPDPSLNQPEVTFTYTINGQRESMTDASGTTSYSYDERDRLTAKVTPQGTLSYTYNGAGQLGSIQSDHANGVILSYDYDALNRLAKVTDHRIANGYTTYTYDNAGSLAGYVYPNGVETNYTYNNLNRLTQMTVKHGTTDLASYAYTLGATGNRTQAKELGGRTVDYAYDALYRLTKETISGVTQAGQNGEIGYAYDPVGNRLSRTSTVSGIANQSFSYNANDQLSTDTYDANGNTTATDGKTYAYDADNRLTSQNGGQVQIVYDGDGNRVSESVGGVKTEYLVDTLNPTGYAQVLEEIDNGSVVLRYAYGSDLISQSLKTGSSWQTSFYGYDGHGSVRFLTDSAGLVTDRYDYEAFGNLVHQEGNTSNKYLYSGEQRDFSLGLDYLRARYLNIGSGRFISIDKASGDLFEPHSLHKYLYVRGDPTNKHDPSGLWTLAELSITTAVSQILQEIEYTTYYKSQVNFLFDATEFIVSYIEPGYRLEEIALLATANGLYDNVVANTYQLGNRMVTEGNIRIASARLGYTLNMSSFTKSLLKDSAFITADALALSNELLNGYSTWPDRVALAKKVDKIREAVTIVSDLLKELPDTLNGKQRSHIEQQKFAKNLAEVILFFIP